MATLFISYSTKDHSLSDLVFSKLVEMGYEKPFRDDHPDSGIPAGSDWEMELYRKLKLCKAMIVLCSRNWMESRWCFAELAYAKAMGKEVFPIILEDMPEPPSVLANRQQIRIGDPNVWERLRKGLEEANLSPGNDFPWPVNGFDECPYPGLLTYEAHHAGVYFGRDEEILELRERMNQMRSRGTPRMLYIVGASGSGKSSLIRAGLVPRLTRMEQQSWLILPTFRWNEIRSQGRSWSEHLALSLVTLYGHVSSKPDWRQLKNRYDVAPSVPSSATSPNSDNQQQLSLSRVAEHFIDDTKDLMVSLGKLQATPLMIIDQFEELLVATDDKTASCFLEFLGHMLSSPKTPWRCIVTVRSDFLSTIQSRRELVAWKEHTEVYSLALLKPEKFFEVIRRPAEKVGITFDSDAIVDQMVKDTGTSDALPLLAFTLRELYHLDNANKHFTLSDYNARLGGLEGCLKKVADDLLNEPNTTDGLDQRERERKLNLTFSNHLVRLNDKGQFVRRTAKWSDLPDQSRSLLHRFIERRLLTSGLGNEKSESSERMVEVAHEALLRKWDKLAGWLEQRRDLLRWRTELENNRQSAGAKWTGLSQAQLAIASEWPINRHEELTPEETAWIKKAKQKARLSWLALCATSTIFLLLTLFAGWKWRQADQLADEQIGLNTNLKDMDEKQRSLNRSLNQAAANNSFVFAMSHIREQRTDQALAQLANAIQHDPSHSSASFALFSLLTRHWHLLQLGEVSAPEPIYQVLYSGTGTLLLRGERTIYQSLQNASPLRELKHDKHVMSMRLCSGAKRLLTTSTTFGTIGQSPRQIAEGTVALWDLGSGQMIASCKVRGMVTDATYDQNEEKVFVSSAFGPVVLNSKLEIVSEPWTSTIESKKHNKDNLRSQIMVHFGTKRLVWIGGTMANTASIVYLWDMNTWKLLDQTMTQGLLDFQINADGTFGYFIGPWNMERKEGNECFVGKTIMSKKSFEPWAVKHTGTISVMKVNAADTRIITASFDSTAHLRRTLDGRMIEHLKHSAPVTMASFSPDGRLIVTGTQMGAIRVWNGFTGEVLSENKWQEGAVTDIAFPAEGGEFVVAHSTGKIYRYHSASTVSRQQIIETGRPRMKSANFLSESDERFLVESDDRIEVWNCVTGKQISQFLLGSNDATVTDKHIDKDAAAVIHRKGWGVFQLSTGTEIATSTANGSKVTDAKFTKDGQRLLTITDGQVHVYSLLNASNKPQIVQLEKEAIQEVRELVGNQIITASQDTLCIWDLNDGKKREAMRHSIEEGGVNLPIGRQSIVDIAVYEDSNRVLVTFGHEGTFIGQPRVKGKYIVTNAQLWSISPLRPVGIPMGVKPSNQNALFPLNNAVMFPKAKRVVTTSASGDMRIWDSESGGLLNGPILHRASMNQVISSPRQEIVAVYGDSYEVSLYSLVNGKSFGNPLKHDSIVKDVRFLGKSDVVATYSEDGAFRFWDLSTSAELPTRIITGLGHRSLDIGGMGDFLVSVKNPGVASIFRVAHHNQQSKTTELASLAEELCGWKVSHEGFEVRNKLTTKAKEFRQNDRPELHDLARWINAPPQSKTCFLGSHVRIDATIKGIISMGPSIIPIMILEYDPTNADLFMLLSEFIASKDLNAVLPLAMLLKASNPKELNATAMLWANHAVQLATDKVSMEKRRTNVISLLATKNWANRSP